MSDDIKLNLDPNNSIDVSIEGERGETLDLTDNNAVGISLQEDAPTAIIFDEGKDTVLTLDGASRGTTDYNALTSKPQINSVTLIGNKTSEEIKVQGLMDEITNQEIDNIIYGG